MKTASYLYLSLPSCWVHPLRPLSKKLSNGHRPFHHGLQLSTSVNHRFRPSAYSVDLSIIRLQTAVAVLAISKSVLIALSIGQCGLPHNELAGHQAGQGAADAQPDNSLDTASRRVLIRRFSHLPSIQHERLKKVRCTYVVRLSLMNRPKCPFPRRSAPTGLASVVFITLLFHAESIWRENARTPSASCVTLKSNR